MSQPAGAGSNILGEVKRAPSVQGVRRITPKSKKEAEAERFRLDDLEEL
jgi:hypothetical protein